MRADRATDLWQHSPVREYPFYIGGTPCRSGRSLEVINPFNGSVVGQTWLAGENELEAAAHAAVGATGRMRGLATYERAEILSRISRLLADNREDVARTLAGEVGKPIRDALTETDRATQTFQFAAEAARNVTGEVIPLDLAPHARGRMGIVQRVPIGPVAAISPFNFPLNLSAHKIAPALAAGNPIVLKPATKTPLSALTLGRFAAEAGAPEGAVSVLPMDRKTGDRLVTDPRFKLLTFTGSSEVGWDMKARAGRKKVILELGGNAAVIVDESADLAFAAARIAAGGFTLAGQSCISVQRVFVHEAIAAGFTGRLVDAVKALKAGDPLDPATDVGPMIDQGETERVQSWIEEAVNAGARVLTGGRALGGALYAPTVLEGAPPDAKVCAEEAFAPLVVLTRFADFEDALAQVNASVFGLQAGVFTASLEHAMLAFDRLEVGGVLVNDVPTWRVDHMPYGGVKDSGLGREGPRYTIEEMTEPRLLVINRQLS
jgi:glyceraldehyde-3-phosphate dehydrogenase (NADP+)